MELLKFIMISYTFGWVLTSWISKLFLYIQKLKWLKYVCQKCITFWSGIALGIVYGFQPLDIFLIGSISALLSLYHQHIFEN